MMFALEMVAAWTTHVHFRKADTDVTIDDMIMYMAKMR